VTGWILVFLASLSLSVVSSVVLVRLVGMAGNRFDLPEGLFGIIAALAANSPEIAAAVAAVRSGQHDVGVGVVLGSNLFNIAALLGLSAIVAGRVHIHRRPLALNGGVSLVIAAVAAVLVLNQISPLVSLLLVLLVFLPYVGVLSLRPAPTGSDGLKAGRVRRYFAVAAHEQAEESRPSKLPRQATNGDLLTLIPVLVAVVFGSVELVNAAVRIGGQLGVGQSVLGALVLGPLTGIPNVIAAVSLARHGRGSAVVSESLSSNSLNVLVGLCLPAILLGTSAVNARAELEVGWLLGLSVLTIGLTGLRGGLLRSDGVLVVLCYLGFAVALAVV